MKKPCVGYECRHGIHSTKPDDCEHDVVLMFYWPKDCPISAVEYVKLNRWGATEVEVVGIPVFCDDGLWYIPVRDGERIFPAQLVTLFHKPEPCAHKLDLLALSAAGHYSKCPKCGAVLSDRRHGKRRLVDRRPDTLDPTKRGRRGGSATFPRRSSKDRRKP